jgi:hypothetical protein
MKRLNYDKKIMGKLLSEPGVKENYRKMTANERSLFRSLLIKQGIYDRYVKEKR